MENIIAALAALFIIQLLNNAKAVIKDHTKVVEFSNDMELVFYGPNRVIKKMAYALCDKNNNPHERKCTVVREKFPDSDDAYSCDVTLDTEKETGELESINVTPFKKDRLILTYMEKMPVTEAMFVKIITIHMDTCKFAQTKLYVDETSLLLPPSISVKIVSFDDVFEVIFRNSTLCGLKLCKQTLDAEGAPIDSPMISFKIKYWPFFAQQIHPMSHSPADGILFLQEYHHEFVLDVLMPDGSQSTFMRYGNHSIPFAISKSNDLVGTCYSMQQSGVQCAQLDLNGNRKLEITLPQSENERIENMYNLADGGFLLLFNRLITDDIPKLCYFIEKVDSTGIRIGTLEKEVFACASDPQSLVILEDEAKEYCISWEKFIGGQGDNLNKLQLFAKCFSDADFQ